MNVLAEAQRVLAAEMQAFEADRLRYAPGLKPFIAEHGLEALVAKAWELMRDKGETHFGRPLGYPFHHGLRVAQNARWLSDQDELRGAEIDRVALFAAAVFHDVSHVDRDDNHQAEGAQVVSRELSGLLTPERVELVVQLVLHSDSHEPALDRVEAQILYDANTLDLHGAMYMWRAVAFAGAAALPMEQGIVALRETMATHQAWAEKVHFGATREALRAKSEEEERVLDALEREAGMKGDG